MASLLFNAYKERILLSAKSGKDVIDADAVQMVVLNEVTENGTRNGSD